MHKHIYTELEREFFKQYIPGHTYMEIQAAFAGQFGWDISISQIKGYMANHRINNGLTGRFPKGNVPQNKGKKGTCAAGCKKSWFQKGHTPKNHRMVGSERITKDGYVEIKVLEPNGWRLKHRLVWEKVHGPIPKGKCLIFLNGRKSDVRVENLMLVDRKVEARMNQSGMTGMCFGNPDSTQAAANVAKLMSALGEAKRKKRIAREN